MDDAENKSLLQKGVDESTAEYLNIFFKNLIGIDHRIVIDDHMKNIFNPSNKVK